jgi:alanyl-tRNA synthetase
MTERLYYHDSFLREFDANVLSAQQEGDRWRIVLDRTAFYPTSGGQPHDTGALGGATVSEVMDAENHEIAHFTDGPVPLGSVQGRIDWERRFDHMQQHSGQHLLSAAFLELFQMPTVSFHLGREVCTIDLNVAALDQRQMELAEKRANEVIFADMPVNTIFGTAEEFAAAGIRKKVEREGLLRAIEMQGFDRQPCGGTHVTRTGQVGVILLRKLEKVKGNWRVEFVCGWRALRAARGDSILLNESARLLTCGTGEVASMVARALEERQAGHRDRQRLTEELAEAEALALLSADGCSGNVGKPARIMHLLSQPDLNYLRLLATKIVARPNVRAVLGTRGGHLIFAQSAGLGGDMGQLLRECLAPVGGKGGGSRDFAQGSLPDASRVESVMKAAIERLETVA